MTKKIFFAFERNLSSLPPLIGLIIHLSKNFDVTISVSNVEDELVSYLKDVKLIPYYKSYTKRNRFTKVFSKAGQARKFAQLVRNYIKEYNPDLIWIASAEAAAMLKPIQGFLSRYPYYLNIYETYDRRRTMLSMISYLAKNAKEVIVPEYNRAHILRLWLGLDRTPTVISNKPIVHPRTRELAISQSLKDKIQGKKVILYQGHITADRNIDVLASTVSDLPDYLLVLLGSGDRYLDHLKVRYSTILFVDYIKPPIHLSVTSWAFIGVVSYQHYSLNTIFCAPNKIWEYSGFGIPMIANDIPGLRYTVGVSGAGICTDMNDEASIISAIQDLDKNYSVYSANSTKMFENEDIESKINTLVADL